MGRRGGKHGHLSEVRVVSGDLSFQAYDIAVMGLGLEAIFACCLRVVMPRMILCVFASRYGMLLVFVVVFDVHEQHHSTRRRRRQKVASGHPNCDRQRRAGSATAGSCLCA